MKKNNNDNKVNETLNKCSSILNTLLKVFTVLITIPLVLCVLGFTALFIISIVLFFKGVTYIGFALGSLFFLLTTIYIIYLISKFLFNKKFQPKPILITSLILILGIGTASGIFLYEISITKYINSVPKDFKTESTIQEFNIDNNFITFFESNDNIHFVTDNTLNNKIKIEIINYKNYTDFKVNTKLIDNYNVLYLDDVFTYSIMNILNSFINNLKNKEIYNYEKIYEPEIFVYTSQDGLNTIHNNLENYKMTYNNDIEDQFDID